MKAATKSVVGEIQKEEVLIQKQQEDLINAQKKIQDNIKNMMIQETVQAEKLLDPRDCYSDELSGGNAAYIKKICAVTNTELGQLPNLSVKKNKKIDKINDKQKAVIFYLRHKNIFCYKKLLFNYIRFFPTEPHSVP